MGADHQGRRNQAAVNLADAGGQPVSASIFLSHASQDSNVAGKICAALEARGLACWVAHRDVAPGQNFQEAITQAIRSAAAMVFVFSRNANGSSEVKKELALAGQYRIPVFPARIEDAKPSDALAYEFATRQWINLFDGWDNAIERLSAQIAGTGSTPAARPVPSHSLPALPDKPSLAVLPFANMSGSPDQEFFSDGLAQDVLTELSRLRWLAVAPRNSSFSFRGDKIDINEASRELNVRYVLEGSVRRAGNRVRVTAQLIDAPEGAHVWAERYDRDLSDIFQVQDEITGAVAAAIGPAIVDAERKRAVRKHPETLGAWEAYQRGICISPRTKRKKTISAGP